MFSIRSGFLVGNCFAKDVLEPRVVTGTCHVCKQPLIEMDNRGQRLTGCMTCNIWWSLTGGGAVKLSVEDLYALQQLKQTK